VRQQGLCQFYVREFGVTEGEGGALDLFITGEDSSGLSSTTQESSRGEVGSRSTKNLMTGPLSLQKRGKFISSLEEQELEEEQRSVLLETLAPREALKFVPLH